MSEWRNVSSGEKCVYLGNRIICPSGEMCLPGIRIICPSGETCLPRN